MKKRLFPLDWRFTLRTLENKDIDELQGSDGKYDYLWKNRSAEFFVGDEHMNEHTLRTLENKDIDELQGSDGKYDYLWKSRSAEFFVGDEHMNEHALEFIFSAPGLVENRYEIKIMTRPVSNWRDFFHDIKAYILKKITNVQKKLN